MPNDPTPAKPAGPDIEAKLETPAMPNRDRRREAPLIDGTAEEVRIVEQTAPESTMAPAEAETKRAAEEPEPDTHAAEAPAEKPGEHQAADAPAAAPRPEPAPRRASGLLGMLGSGAAGAALALVGGYGLLSSQFYSARQVDGLLANGMSRSVAGLTNAVETGQKKLEDQSGKQAADIETLGKRLAAAEALAQRIAAVESRAGEIARAAQSAREIADTARQSATPQVPAPDLGPIEAGMGEFEKRLAAIETALKAPKIETRATDPDVRVPPPGSAPASGEAPAAEIVALAARIAALEGKLVSASAPADLSQVETRLKSLEARPLPKPADLVPLETRLKSLEGRPEPKPADLSPFDARLKELDQRLAPLAEKLGSVEAALGQARSAIGGQAKNSEAAGERASAAALVVAARTLAETLANGAPFAGILRIVQDLGADSSATAALAKHAEKGAPSIASLAAQFGAIGDAIATAQTKLPENAGFADKLASTAGKFVRIRPAAGTTDETAPALVERIRAALARGDVAEALILFEKIPAQSRASGEAWGAALRARAEAGAAVNTILAAALARLSSPK